MPSNSIEQNVCSYFQFDRKIRFNKTVIISKNYTTITHFNSQHHKGGNDLFGRVCQCESLTLPEQYATFNSGKYHF